MIRVAVPAMLSLALSLPGLALADARVRVGHFAPFADTLAATSVTVRVNGADALTGVRFGDFTGYLDLPAGPYLLEVLPSGTNTVAISAQVTLADATDYTVLAVGNGSLQPLSLQALVDDNTPAAAGNLKLRVVHAAPFAADDAGTAVSIRTDGGDVVAGLVGVPFFAASPVLEIPAGRYDLKVATPDGGANLIDLAPLDLPAGVSLTVLATGDGVNQPLGITALPLGAVPLERPVDASVSGHWAVPGRNTTGLAFSPIARQNRLVGSWYGWTPTGQQVFYGLDSSGPRSGPSAGSDGGFDNERAVFTVYSYTGGTFLGAGNVTATPAGTLTVDFLDCTTASASFTLDTGGSGSFDLANLTPTGICSLPPAE
jgi:hypothetical protein